MATQRLNPHRPYMHREFKTKKKKQATSFRSKAGKAGRSTYIRKMKTGKWKVYQYP